MTDDAAANDDIARSVFGEPLEPCGLDPVTGSYRDGCCQTGPEDRESRIAHGMRRS